jgi:hypothetical protein
MKKDISMLIAFATTRSRARGILLGVGLAALCLLAELYVASLPEPRVEWARRLAPAGATRDSALAALSRCAWYRAECRYGEVVDDLIFYGDHGFEKVDLVILTSRCGALACVVTQISSFEPYLWHSVYEGCYDRQRFSD